MKRLSRSLAMAVAFSTSAVAFAQDASSSIVINGAQVTIAEQVELPASEVGILDKLAVREGDLIEDGQLLGRLEDRDAMLAFKRAEAEAAVSAEAARSDVVIRSAQVAHATAKAELARAQEAIEKYNKSVSQTEIDRLKLAVDQTKLQIEQAEIAQRTAKLTYELKAAEVAIAKRKLDRHDIRARVAGRVLEVQKHVGEWVEPGKTVLKVVRLDRLRCKGFVDPQKLTFDPTGHAVQIVIAQGKDKPVTLTGKLVFVHPEVTLKSDIEVWAEFENRDRLVRPGMPAEMTILADSKVATAAQRDK